MICMMYLSELGDLDDDDDDLYDVSDRGVKTFEARSHRPSINNTTGSDLQYGQYRGRHQRVVHLLCGVGPVLEYVSFLALL